MAARASAKLTARLAPGETLGDRVLRVDHAGEHGAVCVYRAQRRLARWTAPDLLSEIDEYIAHEMRHRALFAAELARRGQPRCLSYPVCATLGTLLGTLTGLLGRHAISATTVAIERVVLRHMAQQIAALSASDPAAVLILTDILAEEQEHHDRSAAHLPGGHFQKLLDTGVAAATEAVIWIGMRR
ncbi:ubiquinone biosynthesis monooxygenase Coq7 [Sphingomonas kyeonggiensis]|uniref:demethoxyubiquinone hydroxylase family protein n=1 Tax=Sphingomonas kyeonggiensis TaxID=1268553 RepID=UPI002780E6E4|nr:demethoxyubiquinone hydroxylase family protein [Sphingomonas kyeonggiensis]MDQ0251657.1 ubiquinone biosynthesis monooxygenase Coq7 [Sphingomonas kyeonggiensis]